MSNENSIFTKKEFIKDLCGIVLFPLLITVICITLFFVYLSPTVAVIKDGGQIDYSDEAFIKYRDEQYNKYFGSTSAKDDNILIIFLTTENFNRYYCLAEVGKNIDKNISSMYGGGSSTFGKIVLETVPKENYKLSIGASLTSITNQMSTKVQGLKLSSSFKTATDHSNMADSQLVNYTSISISRDSVNMALSDFTKNTDIPVVVVVDTAETVFGKVMPIKDIMFLSVLVLLAGFCIFVIVRKVVRRVQFEKNISDVKVMSPYDDDDDE